MKTKVEGLIERLQQVESFVARDKGPFTVFALVERADLSDRWDVVVAAPWLKQDRPSILTINEAIAKFLTEDERLLIARVAPVPANSDFVRFIGKNSFNPFVGGAGVPEFPPGPSTEWLGRGYLLAIDPALRAVAA